jgi:hypothetical protein
LAVPAELTAPRAAARPRTGDATIEAIAGRPGLHESGIALSEAFTRSYGEPPAYRRWWRTHVAAVIHHP